MFLTMFNTIIHIFLSLGAFVNLGKGTISFIISVSPSVRLSFRPSALNNLLPTERFFLRNLTFGYF